MAPRSPRLRLQLLAVVAVVALLQLHPAPPRADPAEAAPPSSSAAFVAHSASASAGAAARLHAAALRGQGRLARVARAAAVAAKGKKKPKKYRGVVNPRLRSLLNAKEYRDIISLLTSVKEEGQLDNFLDNAEKYWREINVFDLAMKENSDQGNLGGVLATIKKDWPRIWPAAMEKDRMRAFDRFTAFWGRLERSKLIDDVMKDVLPDMEKDYEDKLDSKDQQRLMDMSDDERRDEVMGRMGESELIKQYAILSEYDAEIQALGPKMAPFLAKFVSILERKVATQTEQLGKTADLAVVGAVALVLLIILAVAGVIKLPDPTWTDLGVQT